MDFILDIPFQRMTDKATLRREALRRRASIVPAPDDAERAASLFMEVLQPGPGQVVALYHPRASELDTLPLSHKLTAAGIAHALPVIQPDSRILRFARWRIGQPLAEGTFRIPEPIQREWLEPDIVVVPLLAFDRHGHRLGYGGGYYDATLASLRSQRNILGIGMGYDQQELPTELCADPHDQRLDHIITPTRTWLFNASFKP